MFIYVYQYTLSFKGDIVALKKLKTEREKEGFPITSLREINTLLKAQHPNIVTVRVGVLCTSYYVALWNISLLWPVNSLTRIINSPSIITLVESDHLGGCWLA